MRLTRVALLVALLALGHAQAAHASVSIFARLAFLSFDSPTTQYCDELASQPAPYADTAGETLAWARAAVSPAGLIVIGEAPVSRRAVASSGITRAPPLG